MAISLTDVNPQTYSNLGEVWLSVSGTGFQDPLNSITGVTAYCSDNNIPFSLPSGHRHILSDSLMIILAPSAADLQVNAKLATLNEYTSDVTIEVLYDLLDDFGNVATPNQIASWQVYCKWLPGVQSITIPNILWMNGSVPGTVTLNETPAPPNVTGVVQVPLLAITNTSRQDVTIENAPVVIAGSAESEGFKVVARQSAVPGDTFTIVSTPDPSLDPYGYYATASAVIGTPPIYLDLPRSFTDGTQVSGAVFVENPIAGTRVRLAVDPPSPNPGIPQNPTKLNDGEYTFTFTPSVPMSVTFSVTVTYGAIQQTFEPYICLKSPPVPPPPPHRPGPI